MADILQLGATFIIAIGLMELLKYAMVLLAKRKNGSNGKNNIQDIDIAILKTQMATILKNHLPHLEAKIDKIDNKLNKIYDLLFVKNNN